MKRRREKKFLKLKWKRNKNLKIGKDSKEDEREYTVKTRVVNKPLPKSWKKPLQSRKI